jgi:hypothetical protein
MSEAAVADRLRHIQDAIAKVQVLTVDKDFSA